MENSSMWIMLIFVLAFGYIFWIHIPAKMARKRGRSALGWVLLTWILQPLWTIILLAVLGDSSDKIRNDIRNERRY
ncbi:MAG: hypothetical protein J6Q37_04620 [Bacteroidales bacterium]|nr:hypothetical protein [Bacteroidales bacterium]